MARRHSPFLKGQALFEHYMQLIRSYEENFRLYLFKGWLIETAVIKREDALSEFTRFHAVKRSIHHIHLRIQIIDVMQDFPIPPCHDDSARYAAV